MQPNINDELNKANQPSSDSQYSNTPTPMPNGIEPPQTFITGSQLQRQSFAANSEKMKRGLIFGAATIGVLAVTTVALFLYRTPATNNTSAPAQTPINSTAPLSQPEKNNAPSSDETLEQITTSIPGSTNYKFLYFTKYRDSQYCFNNPGKLCGRTIGNISGYPEVQLSIIDSRNENITNLAAYNCKDTSFVVRNAGKDINVCAQYAGSSIAYYSFVITLEDREHLGILTGLIDSDDRIVNISMYENHLKEIIQSIELA